MLERLVDDLVEAGIHGLSPLGSTGEVMYLTAPQRRAVVDAVVRAACGRVPVVPAVAAFSTHDATEQARRYEEEGASGLVVMLQKAFPVPEEAAVRYFREVAESVSCPVVVYLNPSLLGTDLSVRSLAELAETPNVRYLKDASGRTGRILSVMNVLGDRLGIFSASAHIPLSVLELGGVGWMAGPACVAPGACLELWRRFAAGDREEAMALQRELWHLNEIFERYALAACVKAALRMRGYEVGDPLPPQQPVGQAAVEEIAAVLTRLEAALAAGPPG